MNVHSEEDRLQLMVSCAFTAVQTGFQHIALRDLIDPPHAWQDALLARQIAIRILAETFWLPRRRIATLLSRNNTSISIAVSAINYRLDDPVFCAAYERMAGRAMDLFMVEMQQAAA